MEDVIVRYLKFPSRVRGMVLLDEEGDYNIYIDPRLSHEAQQEVLQHELQHIERDDFYNDLTISEVEGKTWK